jgi:hypothetical protein
MTFETITPHRLIAALFIVFLCLTLMVVSQRRGWKPTLLVTLGFAVVVRVAFLYLTWKTSPYDLANDFHSAAKATLHHHDPILDNFRPQGWAALPTYTFVLAGALWTTIHLHWSWLIAARIPAMVCDILLVPVVGKLVTASGGSTGLAKLRRFQYACSPVAIIISSEHGQLEPFCLLFAFLALVVVLNGGQTITPRRAIAGGVLLTVAISGQTWPILFGPALLAALPTWRRRIQATVAGAATWILIFVTMPLTVGTPIDKFPYLFKHMTSNQPTIGTFGWAGVWVTQHPTTLPVWSDPMWVHVAKYGTKLALLGVLLAVFWWRRAHPLDMATASVTALIAITPAFGTQYLQWPVPSSIAKPTKLTLAVQITTGLTAAMFYLPMQMMQYPLWNDVDDGMMFASVALVIFMVIALPWQRRVWDRSQTPPDLLDGPTGETGEAVVSDRASDEAAPESGQVHHDDLPERVSDVAGSDRGPGSAAS